MDSAGWRNLAVCFFDIQGSSSTNLEIGAASHFEPGRPPPKLYAWADLSRGGETSTLFAKCSAIRS